MMRSGGREGGRKAVACTRCVTCRKGVGVWLRGNGVEVE